MEVISNLLQAAVTLLGFFSGRYPVSEKPETGVFPADLLLWLFFPWIPLLDAVSALIFQNAAGLLCVRVRLGSKCHFPFHAAIRAFFGRRKEISVQEGPECRPDRCSAVHVLLHIWRYPLQSALVRYDDHCFLFFYPGTCLCQKAEGNCK